MFGYGIDGYALGLESSQYNNELVLTKVGVSGVYSLASITDTNWHHVAVTTTNGAVVFYIDGAAYPAGNFNPGYTFATAPAIGGKASNLNAPNNNSFLGAIDELSVYSRALSAAEIQSIYQAGAAGKSTSIYLNPTLSIAGSGSSVTIWWPAAPAGYSLQQNSDLASLAGWTASSYPVTTNANGTNSITIAPPVRNLFFRLSNP